MGVRLHYQKGQRKPRVWGGSDGSTFTALIKCYVKSGKKTDIIEKPATRPATLYECYRFAEKLKSEYGKDLKQIIVWDLDELKKSRSNW